MRFLIIQKVKREVPVEKWAKLLPLQFRYFDQLEKQKTLESVYHLIGHQGSMLVISVDSDEVLSRVIGEDPMFFHMDREIYPLTTRKNHEKRIKAILQKE
jgi:muconolactone delta-isomerase